MRKTFQKYLFIFVFAAFILTFWISYDTQTSQAEKNAVSLLELRTDDAKNQIKVNQRNLDSIRDLTSSSALANARAVARMIVLNPDFIYDSVSLGVVADELDVEDISISDSHGIVTASVLAPIGYDMSSSPQSAAFMGAIYDADFALVQDPMARGSDNVLFQYVGVARLDQPGIVQIGYTPERLAQAMQIANVENLSAGFRIGTNGQLLLCQNGEIVSISDTSWLHKPVDDFGISASLIASGSGNFYASINGQKMLCVYSQYSDYTVVGLLPEEEMYLSRDDTSLSLILYNMILFAVVFVLVSALVQKIVINGIHNVNRSLSRITQGDLDERIQVRTNPEFTSLSDGINSTVNALKDAIAEAAARIDKELEFARAIQLSSLPALAPAFSNRPEFEIAASMHTAREVGGDFYDVFMIGKSRLGLVVADVSGKGIPAALFMMTAKTQIKNEMQAGGDLGKKFTAINNMLCENNETGMFVTVFAAVLHIETGALTVVSAGHNPPMLRRANGEYSRLACPHGFILGGMENICYKTCEAALSPGDALFMYTDGVTEAADPSDSLFGEPRLLDFLNGHPALPLEELLSRLKGEIDAFSASAEQTDDITMLAIKFKGGLRSDG